MITALRNAVQPYLRFTYAVLGRTAQEEHQQILRAAEERDAELLNRLTVEHLNRTASGLIHYLESAHGGAATHAAGGPSQVT
jgi:DNA-binding GntR family transcriptional regulator